MSFGSFGPPATRNRTDLFLKYRIQARGTTRVLGVQAEDRLKIPHHPYQFYTRQLSARVFASVRV
jgi:hypothetical protein